MGIFAKIFGFIGGLGSFALISDEECLTWLYDEPECPKSLIEK